MIELYDYTNGKKVVLGSFDNWLDAEKAFAVSSSAVLKILSLFSIISSNL